MKSRPCCHFIIVVYSVGNLFFLLLYGAEYTTIDKKGGLYFFYVQLKDLPLSFVLFIMVVGMKVLVGGEL